MTADRSTSVLPRIRPLRVDASRHFVPDWVGTRPAGQNWLGTEREESGESGFAPGRHVLRSAEAGDAAKRRPWVGRRERRGPKGASNRESTPEADAARMAPHDAYKEAEHAGRIGYPQADAPRSTLSP